MSTWCVRPAVTATGRPSYRPTVSATGQRGDCRSIDMPLEVPHLRRAVGGPGQREQSAVDGGGHAGERRDVIRERRQGGRPRVHPPDPNRPDGARGHHVSGPVLAPEAGRGRNGPGVAGARGSGRRRYVAHVYGPVRCAQDSRDGTVGGGVGVQGGDTDEPLSVRSTIVRAHQQVARARRGSSANRPSAGPGAS